MTELESQEVRVIKHFMRSSSARQKMPNFFPQSPSSSHLCQYNFSDHEREEIRTRQSADMLPLRLATQSYAWGVPAAQPSKVLDLARANGVEGTSGPEPDETFAELWVGTHPSGASVVPVKTAAAAAQGTLSLEAWLEHHPEALGRVLAERRAVGQPTGRLPFLMKVLSINKALPLQAHPTTDSAGAMHEAHPDLYPDAAHKPEMVISLSGFCGFAGFLGPDKMQQLLTDYPQLNEVLGANNVLQYLEATHATDNRRRQLALAAMWDHLLLRTPKDIAATVCSAVLTLMQDKAQAVHHPSGHQPPPAAAQPTGTISSTGQHPGSMEAQQAATAAALSGPDNLAKACDLALALSVLGSKPGGLSQRLAMLSAAASAWPDDPVGVLGLMLLEDVVLGPGEAVIIPAGCPHAYVCGEVLEVQAASNNTIKGGLTAPGEPTDKEGLVAAATGGLLQASGQASTPALQAGMSISTGDAATNLASATSSSGTTGVSSWLHEGPPNHVEPHGLTALTGVPSGGGAAAEVLRLYQPEVDEFQVLHCAVPGSHKAELVVDPGPAVLLVVGGKGRAMVRAAAVSDTLLMDETDLQPGTALFLSAGSSLSISGSSSSAPLDAWITTANNRLFSAAAAAPAGEAEAMQGLQLSPGTLTTPDAAGKAGAALTSSPVDPGATFTAAEQVAAGIMMGAADSSVPANAAAAAAAAQEQQESAMQVD